MLPLCAQFNAAVMRLAQSHFAFGEQHGPGRDILADAFAFVSEAEERRLLDRDGPRYDVVLSDLYNGENPLAVRDRPLTTSFYRLNKGYSFSVFKRGLTGDATCIGVLGIHGLWATHSRKSAVECFEVAVCRRVACQVPTFDALCLARQDSVNVPDFVVCKLEAALAQFIQSYAFQAERFRHGD
eukprot:6208677-Pleurochrysis_carterae.AAC.8